MAKLCLGSDNSPELARERLEPCRLGGLLPVRLGGLLLLRLPGRLPPATNNKLYKPVHSKDRLTQLNALENPFRVGLVRNSAANH